LIKKGFFAFGKIVTDLHGFVHLTWILQIAETVPQLCSSSRVDLLSLATVNAPGNSYVGVSKQLTGLAKAVNLGCSFGSNISKLEFFDSFSQLGRLLRFGTLITIFG